MTRAGPFRRVARGLLGPQRLRLRESTVMADVDAQSCLRAAHVGRLLRVRRDVPILDLVRYVLVDDQLYLRAPEKSLLNRTNVGVPVVLEVDCIDDHTGAGWSVVAHGVAATSLGPVPAAVRDALHEGNAASPELGHVVRVMLDSVVGRRYK